SGRGENFWKTKMTNLFYLYDADGDGSITPVDFEILASKLSGLVGQDNPQHSEQYATARKTLCEEIMRADSNHDGKVTLDEWLEFHQRLRDELTKPDTDPELLEQLCERVNTTFKMLDLNNDGMIEKDEWMKTCQFFGVKTEAAEKAFNQIAKDGKLKEDKAKKLFFEYIKSDDPDHISNCCLCFL
ncbi:unnamed protein product, partial [Didymodactylos carnosus]